MASDHQLRSTLTQLESQLEVLREADPAVAARLRENIEQAQQVLAGRRPAVEHRTLVDQLRDAVLELEASHPTLAQNLGGLIDALARLGI